MTRVPTVHVAMMQKDEGPILERWLLHYSALFGYESLSIYDNCSTDPATLSLLFQAESLGARVYRNRPTYRDKHTVFLKLFRKHDARTNKADFYIPVDCDEYLVALTPEGVSFDRGIILTELERHREERRSLQIPGSLYNDPGQKGAYVMDRPFVKSFFRSGAIGSLDIGFHFGMSGLEDGVEEVRLIYLHHHNKQLEAAKATARSKLAAAEATDYFGAGAQYLRWLINCPETDYLQRYRDRLRVTLLPGEPVHLLFPDGRQVAWDGQSYLRRYPDVQRSYALGALHHYLSRGYDQRRYPTPVVF